jgi:hypothetical protein
LCAAQKTLDGAWQTGKAASVVIRFDKSGIHRLIIYLFAKTQDALRVG